MPFFNASAFAGKVNNKPKKKTNSLSDISGSLEEELGLNIPFNRGVNPEDVDQAVDDVTKTKIQDIAGQQFDAGLTSEPLEVAGTIGGIDLRQGNLPEPREDGELIEPSDDEQRKEQYNSSIQGMINNFSQRQGGNIISGAMRSVQGMVSFGQFLADQSGNIGAGLGFQKIAHDIGNVAQGFDPKGHRTFTDDVFSGVGSMATFLVPSGVVGLGMRGMAGLGSALSNTIGMSVMTGLESMTEAGMIYEETGDRDATLKSFGMNVVVLALTNRFGLGSGMKVLLEKALLSGGFEGIQEGAQEIIGTVAKGGGLEDINWDNVIRSAEVGAIVGGGASVVIPETEGRYQDNVVNEIVELHNETGGSSVPPAGTGAGAIKKGFAVSQEGGMEVEGRTISKDDIQKFININEEELNKNNKIIGTWYDAETDKTIIDVTEVIPSKLEAIEKARNQNQKAIFDYKADKVIDLDPKAPEQPRTGQQNTAFFTEKSKAASSEVPYSPVLPIGETKVSKDYQEFGGNFTGHISKMIPTFQEKQIKVAEAITRTRGIENVLDIGGSEGTFGKSISNNSKIRTVTLDPNSQMKKNFESTKPVEGAEFKQEALGASFVDEDGTNIPMFAPDEFFDIINEDFTFQFISNDREGQVNEVKSLLKEDGVFITSEKFHTENQEANEKKKLEHQQKYFNDEQLTEDKQGIITGMARDQVKDVEYEQVLKDNFEYVEQFWDAGNFKGYMASDSKAQLKKIKSKVGDLSSEFSDVNSLSETKFDKVNKAQNSIPQEHQLPVYHFSDNIETTMVTDPARFGEQPFSKTSQKTSPEKRTFFFADPKDVLSDTPALRNKNMYTGVVDARKLYDSVANSENFGEGEGGAVNRDLLYQQAKDAGWKGVRTETDRGTMIEMFEEVAVERPDRVPTLKEILAGRWDQSVQEARQRLNSGHYGKQLFDITTAPVVVSKFAFDVGKVLMDNLIKQGKKLGSPVDWTKNLMEQFGDTYPVEALRRIARESYEFAKSIRLALKEKPLEIEQVTAIKDAMKKELASGNFSEYVPTGKGITIVGGDALDFEGNQRKAVGIRFPKDQALGFIKADKDIIAQQVAFRRSNGDILTGQGGQIHAQLFGELIDNGTIQEDIEIDDADTFKSEGVEDDVDYITSGFLGSDGKFYSRPEVALATGVEGESTQQGVDRMGKEDIAEIRKGQRQTFPIWATDKGVARQIERSAVDEGNDTMVFVQYPDIWNAIFTNYDFQVQLAKQLEQEVGRANMPKLPTEDEWAGRGSRIGMHPSSKDTKATWLRYEKEIKNVIKNVKKSKSGEEAKQWNQQNLARSYAVENAINLGGKMIGVAKFSHLNHGEDRQSPHPRYNTELSGFNYVEFKDPISFGEIQTGTEGTDVGVEGVIKDAKGARREALRQNQMFRILQQRGLKVTADQADIVGALIQASEGDLSGVQQWVKDNPHSTGEIFDEAEHAKWQEDNKVDQQTLIENADKELQQFLAPFGAFGFFNPQTWKGLSVVGKIIARGAKGFASWTKAMVNTLGEWVRPLLRSLWTNTNQMPNTFKKAGVQETNTATDPEGTKPDPVDQAKVAKKATHPVGTLPSQTAGYNLGKEHPSVGSILAPTLEALRKQFDIQRRGVITNEELMKRARNKATELTDADILDLDMGTIKNAEDAQAIRIYVSDQMLKVIDEIAKNAQATEPLLIKNMSDELTRVMRMEMNLRAIAGEGGRLQQSFSIPMSQEIIDGFNQAVELMNQLDPENRYGGKEVGKIMKDLTGEAKVEKAPSKLKSIWEMIRFVFLNWILQNPLTDMANIHGNLTNLTFHVMANVGNLGGARNFAKSVNKGWKEGLREAKQVLLGEREAISKFTEGSKVELPKSKGVLSLLKLAVPTTRLGMEDAFFRAMARNIETQRMVTKTSRKMGVSPDEIQNAITDIITDPKMEKYTKTEYVELAKYLRDIEDELVFQKELGTVGKSFTRISKILFPIIPFVTTPANIIKFGVSWTPLGASKLLKKGLSNEEKNQIIRRSIAGTTLMSGIGSLIVQGVIEVTGGGSDDAYERDLQAKLGYKPNHLYINTPFGKWGGSYMNINPINTMLQVIGDMSDKYKYSKGKDDPIDELSFIDESIQQMSDVALSIGKSVTDQSFLRGVSDFMDYLAGRKPDWGMRMLSNFGRMGSVQGVQRITGTEDRRQFDTKGRVGEQFQKNIPFISNEGLVPSVSAFGEQRVSQFERFPFPFSEVAGAPAYKWLEEKGLRLRIPSKSTKIGNREMSRFEYVFFAKGVGQIMDQTIQQLFEQQQNAPEDKKLTDEELQDKIDSVDAQAKKRMKEELKKKITEQFQLKEGTN
jgi:hypothetical protein